MGGSRLLFNWRCSSMLGADTDPEAIDPEAIDTTPLIAHASKDASLEAAEGSEAPAAKEPTPRGSSRERMETSIGNRMDTEGTEEYRFFVDKLMEEHIGHKGVFLLFC